MDNWFRSLSRYIILILFLFLITSNLEFLSSSTPLSRCYWRSRPGVLPGLVVKLSCTLGAYKTARAQDGVSAIVCIPFVLFRFFLSAVHLSYSFSISLEMCHIIKCPRAQAFNVNINMGGYRQRCWRRGEPGEQSHLRLGLPRLRLKPVCLLWMLRPLPMPLLLGYFPVLTCLLLPFLPLLARIISLGRKVCALRFFQTFQALNPFTVSLAWPRQLRLYYSWCFDSTIHQSLCDPNAPRFHFPVWVLLVIVAHNQPFQLEHLFLIFYRALLIVPDLLSRHLFRILSGRDSRI